MASDAGEACRFDTQINATALIAEINLLVEYVSGRSDRSLGGGQQLRIPDGFKDYGAMLSAFFDIRGRASQSHAHPGPDIAVKAPPDDAAASPALTADNLRFLVEFRDYLNSAAYPASGSTIAFSTFVSDGRRLCDARQAYPLYGPLARKLRRSLLLLRGSALIATVLVAVMGAYVYWGNAIVTSASSAITQQDDLAKDIAREEATGVTRLEADTSQTPMAGGLFTNQILRISGTGTPLAGQPTPAAFGFLGLCDAIAHSDFEGNHVQVFLSSTQEFLCNQNTALSQQITDFQVEAETWYGFSHHLFPYQPRALRNAALLMQVAPHEISVINGYAIPLVMGFLGSAAFVLRGFLQRLGDRVLTTRDVQSNRVRLVLGILSGLAVGFFLSPSGNGGSSTDTLGLGISLTAPALAFLAGYAVDVLFKFLDALAGRALTIK